VRLRAFKPWWQTEAGYKVEHEDGELTQRVPAILRLLTSPQ